MREKLLWVAVVVLLIGGVSLGYGLYQQNKQISKLSMLINTQAPTLPATQIPAINSPTQTVKVTTPIATPVVAQTTVSGRTSFGPQISADGRWLLSTDEVEIASVPSELKNRLVLKGLFGQGDKVLLSDKANIQPAGWSADGSKVYYVTNSRAASDGCGGAYPDQTPVGDTVYEVTVATGKAKSLFQVQGSICGGFYGIHDVYATKNIVLFEQPVGSTGSTENFKYNIYVSDLTGGSKKLVATVSGTDGVAADTISPDASRFAVVTNHNIQGFDFTYKLLVVDIASGAKKEVAMPKNNGNYFNGWVDNNTISVTSGNGTKNIQVP